MLRGKKYNGWAYRPSLRWVSAVWLQHDWEYSSPHIQCVSLLWGSQAVAGRIMKALIRKVVCGRDNYTRLWEFRRASWKTRHLPGVPKHKESLARLGEKERCPKEKKGTGWQARDENKLGGANDRVNLSALEQKAAAGEADRAITNAQGTSDSS